LSKQSLALLFVLLGGTASASPGPQPLPPPAPIPTARDVPYPGTIKLSVDVSDTARRVFKVHEEIPVSGGGELVLLYPRWLPGVHAPQGTIDRLAAIVVRAGNRELPWVRDVGDVFAFRVAVPAGVKVVTVDFQYLSPVNRAVGTREVGRELVALDWCATVLYPAGHFTRQIPVQASVILPAGWKAASALEPVSTRGGTVVFETAPLETVIDSPVRAGRFHKRYDLAPGDKTPVTLELMADRPDVLEVPPAILELQRALVQQAYRLFGARHYDRYRFLLQLSDDIGMDTTLEHHRSATYGDMLEAISDWDKTAAFRDVFAHEYVHSWDGKFRRPADLWTPDYNTPMRNSLLWVYEGGTQYWGEVLTARSGLWSKQQALDSLAMTAAYFDRVSGRSWRPLQDTTNDEIINPRRPMSWASWQRFEDYYSEGALIWLDADTLIREQTQGKKSLDDFARAFFGIEDGSYVPVTYTFDDVVKTLNGVHPHDWAGFLRQRLDGRKAPPLDGITRGGYRLVFRDRPSDFWMSMEETRLKGVDHTYSIGIVIDKDAIVAEVLWESPAWKAGLTAGSRIVAVDGLAFEPPRLAKAIQHAKGTKTAIELLIQHDNLFRTVRLDYHDGLRYPHLERDPKRPALLDAIHAPRTN
jgi:predicted metalloprotease with PDZ domain